MWRFWLSISTCWLLAGTPKAGAAAVSTPAGHAGCGLHTYGPVLRSVEGRRVRHVEIGVTWDRPVGYEALPIPRSQAQLKLSFVRRIEGLEEPLTWNLFRLEDPPRPQGALEAFCAQTLGVQAAGEVQALAALGDYRRESLTYERGLRRGMAFAYLGPEYHYFLVGEAPGSVYDDEARRWRRWAGELRLHSPKENARLRATLTRRYAGERLSDPERRIAARLSLVDGWSAYDGERYIYLVHGLHSQAWKDFDKELMGVRRYLTEHLLTHPNQEPKDVGVVRLCRDRTEYLDFGGIPHAVGYFSPMEDELVLYAGEDPAAFRAVMRHESFHQYIYTALGGIPPHIWFDEGYAEFMASAEVGSRRVVGFQPIEAHLHTLKAMVAEGGPGLMPLEDFLRMSQPEFYDRPGPHYAQAWIWVDFLVRSDYGMRSSRGEDFIKRYVRALREGWAFELERAARGEPLSWSHLEAVREAALQAALRGFDFEVAERAFQRYVGESVAFLPD